jgi:predicted SprT family Zn-dependent metalloprotease
MITSENYKVFEDAYMFFNEKLFDNKLPECLIVFQQRKSKILGSFSSKRYYSRNGEEIVSELTLNPDNFINRTDEEILSTLVHEMCHVWQIDVEKEKSTKYHDKSWGITMESLGLIPSNTGKEGGKKTGIQMTQYIDEQGKFIYFAREFLENNKLKWNRLSSNNNVPKKERKRNKFKFICSECGQIAWGKEDAEIVCGKCMTEMEIEIQ